MVTTSKSMREILRMYNDYHLDFDAVYENAQIFLKSYRKIVWGFYVQTQKMEQELPATYGVNLSTALVYLSDIAPENRRKSFEQEVNRLFDQSWLLKIVSGTMHIVRSFPNRGALYADIISLAFLDGVYITDKQVYTQLNMDHSLYYERRKEAIALFGVCLWGRVLPMVNGTYEKFRHLGLTPQECFSIFEQSQTKLV